MAHLFLELPSPPSLPLGDCLSRTAFRDPLPTNTLLFCPTPNSHPLRTAMESSSLNAAPPPRGHADSVEVGREGAPVFITIIMQIHHAKDFADPF